MILNFSDDFLAQALAYGVSEVLICGFQFSWDRLARCVYYTYTYVRKELLLFRFFHIIHSRMCSLRVFLWLEHTPWLTMRPERLCPS